MIFCWLRDGEIASSAKIQDGAGESDAVAPQETTVINTSSSEKDYLKYLIKMRRLKPAVIDSA